MRIFLIFLSKLYSMSKDGFTQEKTMKLGRVLVRRFKRANKALARDRGQKAYERALADGMPREQVKQFAKITRRNSLR